MEPVKRGCKHPGNMPLLGIALWIVISLLHMVPPCTQTLTDPEKGGQKGGSKIGHFGWSDHEDHPLDPWIHEVEITRDHGKSMVCGV